MNAGIGPEACHSASNPIPVIGVVGGIGSGKSAVTRWVGEHANVLVIDADQLGHLTLFQDDVKTALRRRFGADIFENGEIQRRLLARHVFGDGEEHRQARKDLERIVHPAIKTQIIDLIRDASLQSRSAVLLDAAILLEAGWEKCCDAVVFVDAPEEVRQRRVAARSGWSTEDLQRREASQWPLEEKKRHCTFVISNADDNSKGGQALLDFLCRNWGNCCKPLPNSSQQS